MSFEEVVKALEAGTVRVAEKTAEGWKVNAWVKEAILEGFRIGKLVDMSKEEYSFFDKDTLPLRKFSLEDKVRIVPGGSSVRTGAYLAPSVIMMPPSYVNIGAYVDSGTMVDSHALARSRASVSTFSECSNSPPGLLRWWAPEHGATKNPPVCIARIRSSIPSRSVL